MILLDMDGVLCDFLGATLRLFDADDRLASWPAGTWDVEPVLGITTAELWGRIDEQGMGFWAELPEYPWAAELVAALERIDDVVISTAPSRSHHSAAGKMIWLDRHFGGRFRGRYMMGSRKELMARPEVCLVDDRDENVRKFRKAGGAAVLVPQPWNAGHWITGPKVGLIAGALHGWADSRKAAA